MKNQLLKTGLFFAMICSSALFAQEQNVIPCATTENLEMVNQKDPTTMGRVIDAQMTIREIIEAAKKNQGKAAAVQYTIPIVFHILHQGGNENIPASTIISALDWVNKDFAKANNDATLTATPFYSLYINSDIVFKLAKKDPQGNCTDGITRHIDPKTNWDQAASYVASYNAYTWDPTKYLNIYVVSSIAASGTVTGGGFIVGYARFPGTHSPGDVRDAIVYRYDYLAGPTARSLTHEIGHMLSLPHIWGITNAPAVQCGDDGMNDTPPTMGHQFNCPTSLSGNPCPGSGGIDNVQNIMNYSSCDVNFTTDQTNAMRALLNSTVAGRQNLKSASNLIATDVDGTITCPPVCEWLSTNQSYTVCAGSNLIMRDASYNGSITSYAWAAQNANLTSPTASQCVITFTTPGTSLVTLTVSNGAGTDMKTRTVTVVDPTPQVPKNYFQSFEGAGVPQYWTIENKNPGSITWEQTSMASSHLFNSYFIEGPSNIANQIDYLYMPPINATYLDNTFFSFDYAYARQTPTHNDKFELQYSINCGGTWNTFISLNAQQMAANSGGVDGNLFVPTPSQWVTYDVTQHPLWVNMQAYSSLALRFMFKEDEGGIGFGNRFFLDNIIYSDPTGVNELSKSIHFSMAPNPTTGEATVRFTLSDVSTVKLEVVDITGRAVLAPQTSNLLPGDQKLTVNSGNTLGKGMYFVNLEVNGARISRKLIIE